jgi:hypothetical protein
MINICNRKVMPRKGTKTQTINICTEENVRGQYDYIIRLRPPFINDDMLKNKNFESIEAFVRYLEKKHHGTVEKTPDSKALQESERQSEMGTGLASSWIEEAVSVVEQSINQFVREFIYYPYLHRVEHSIHCELYRILSNQRLFMMKIPIERWLSQPVQKEWPEWIPRPEKGNRRGNFDLCIVSPDDTKTCLFSDFREGRVKPPIVIELGLDYGLSHLKGDATKIINSKIKYGYLVHLLREEVVDDFNSVEDFLLTLEREHNNVKTAYARVTISHVAYKLIGDTQITKFEKKDKPLRTHMIKS